MSLMALMLTAGGCTKFTSALDWVAAGDEPVKVADVGANDPDLYQRALPREMTATIPVGGSTPGAAPRLPFERHASASRNNGVVVANDNPVLPDLPPEKVRKVTYSPPPSAPLPRQRTVRAPVPAPNVRDQRRVSAPPPQSGGGKSLYSDPQEPDEMLSARQSVDHETRPETPAGQPARPVKVASLNGAVPVAPGPGSPPRAPEPPAAGVPGSGPDAPQQPALRGLSGPKKNAGRSGTFDWFKLDKGRHTREMTPVERLRATRGLLGRQRSAAMMVPPPLSGAAPPGALGLGGPVQQGGAPLNGPAQASLQGGPTAPGLAQSAAQNRPLPGAPNGGAGQAGIPNRERPMRIYFAPGRKKLSSQTIASIVAVAETQRTVKRPVHVVGVAAAKGGEGNGFNTDSLNRLALERANAVARELTANGVPKKSIVIHAQQEHRSEAAASGSQTARSRRVDIYLE